MASHPERVGTLTGTMTKASAPTVLNSMNRVSGVMSLDDSYVKVIL